MSSTIPDRIEDEFSPAAALNRSSQWVGPVRFVSCRPSEAVRQIIGLAEEGVGVHVHLANAYTVALADASAEYRNILAEPAINYPDGKPIGWTSALKRQAPVLQQVRGPQLFLDVFDEGRTQEVKHFLLGSTPEVLDKLERELRKRFPGVRIVGVESPPFRKLTSDELRFQDERIRASGAEIVWVGLGTPKQDFEAHRLAGSLPVVAVAIGAAFDFAAGAMRPAPNWMTAVGLEWVYRFAREPKRLWKRYLFGNVRFLKTAFFDAPVSADPPYADSLPPA
jgi:N-acetylglucosaminyldiphosphoundecaprenol N-acetyl-beta-D-mannosaminyltransferase